LGGVFVLLQSAIRDLLGPQAGRQTVRLLALSVVSQCVFYCLARENWRRAFPQWLRALPDRGDLAEHIVHFSIEALQPPRPGAVDEHAVDHARATPVEPGSRRGSERSPEGAHENHHAR